MTFYGNTTDYDDKQADALPQNEECPHSSDWELLIDHVLQVINQLTSPFNKQKVKIQANNSWGLEEVKYSSCNRENWTVLIGRGEWKLTVYP